MGLVGSCLALLVLIIAGFVILGGTRVVMVLLLDHGRVPLSCFSVSFWDSFVIPLGLGVLFLLALFHLGIVLLGLLANPATWRLLVSGHVANVGAVREAIVDDAGQEVCWVSVSAHLARFMIQSRPWLRKRLRHVRFSSVSIPDHKRWKW